ncbi:MAG TPA: hypothetical protein VFY16_01065 [Gemmatimonadaceae bacterium]|nr:hypothetical protein [Gemmatimonadaceae bacterium]
MRALVPPLVVVLAACGATTSGEPPVSSAPRPVTVNVGERAIGRDAGALMLTPEDTRRVDSLAAPPARALVALKGAYDSLGIEVTLIEPSARRLGNPRFVARRSLAGEPMRRWLRCSETITGARVERDRITFSVVSTVRASDAEHSLLETRVEAFATDVTAGTGGAGQPCTSTGLLEQRLHEQARRALAP